MRNGISEIRPGLKFSRNYCNFVHSGLWFRCLSREVCCGFPGLTFDVFMVCGSYLKAQSHFFIASLQIIALAINAKKDSSNNLTTIHVVNFNRQDKNFAEHHIIHILVLV
jgi:hypothetical protein